LLRALAATSEAELDTGRWTRDVQTIAGEMTFELSLPLLLEQTALAAPPRGETASSKLPAERALDLCVQAEEVRGRREIQLLRAALDLDPDCVEALLMLAQRTPDVDTAIPTFQRAVDAAARNLGPGAFERLAGHFWGARETRLYLTVRQHLVGALLDAGRDEEAADHLREMLRLNPGDNQGNRYVLAHCLLRLNRLDELESLLNRADYRDDGSADWAFARALLAFRRHGDAPDSRNALRQAQESNPFVVPLLLSGTPMPPMMPQAFSPGSEQDAILCVEQLADEWYRTPGALEWLETAGKTIRKAKSTGKKKGRGRT
jgi:tetratricopeptide (TPR) repeat protein